jgi:hypothetical protein
MTCAQSNSVPSDARTRHAVPLGAVPAAAADADKEGRTESKAEADAEADAEAYAEADAEADAEAEDGSAGDREVAAAGTVNAAETVAAAVAAASSNTSVLRSTTRPRGAASTKAAPVSTRVPLASTTASRAAATCAADKNASQGQKYVFGNQLLTPMNRDIRGWKERCIDNSQASTVFNTRRRYRDLMTRLLRRQSHYHCRRISWWATRERDDE